MRKVSAEAGCATEILGAPATPRQAVMALAMPAPVPLVQETSKSAPFPKAKRSKAVVEGQVPPVRVSARAKGAKGNLPSLQRAQLLQAQKNLETSVNPLPRFTILDSFSDTHLGVILGDNGVDLACEGDARSLILLVRSKELAQATLASAAAARAATTAEGAGTPSTVAVLADLSAVSAGDDTAAPPRLPQRTRRI